MMESQLAAGISGGLITNVVPEDMVPEDMVPEDSGSFAHG
jgi:hypothetical protein